LKENLKELNVDGSELECSCLNNWLLEQDYVTGYDCEKENDEKCSPVVIRDNYEFDFALETPQNAYVNTTQR